MTQSFDSALARLDDYLRGQPDEAQAATYEEDLFERALAAEAPDLAWREGLTRTLQTMQARGTLQLWLTARGVEHLLAGPLRVRRFEPSGEQVTTPDLSGDFDILLTRVVLPLQGVRRLDAEILAPNGVRLKVMPDIEFDPADGAVFACCEAGLARASAAARAITRVWATDDSGRRLLAEFHSAPAPY